VCVVALLMFGTMPVMAAQDTHSGMRGFHRIVIIGDLEFTKKNGVGAGSGTAADPYVIQGLKIDARHGTGILIKNTSSYFVIRNVIIRSGIDSLSNGINLVNVTNGFVQSVNLVNNWIGLYVQVSSNVVVRDSNISSSGYAGVIFEYSSDSSIEGNSVFSCEGYGLGLFDSDRVAVANNVISFNKPGAFCAYSSQVTVTGNVFLANTYGMFLASLYHRDNIGFLIHGNSFIDNGAYEAHFLNQWDDGYPVGGNYWADYAGTDQFSGPLQDQPGSDGLGDTPYVLSIYSDAEDRYPLMQPPV